jgi:RNase P/RNase MRP subunit POP5
MGIYLTKFDGEKGIVRCNHIEKENAIKLLRSINKIYSNEVEIKTLGTSGTIKSLMKKHMEK